MPPSSRYVLLTLDEEVDATCLGAEIVRCRSAEEACAQLGSGRRFSAVMARPGAHAGLVDAAARSATPLIVLDHATAPSSPTVALGPSVRPVVVADRPPPEAGWPAGDVPDWRARLVAVCGPGGTGTSCIAAALAAELAGGAGAAVLLADFALRADQALLHGLADPGTGLLDVLRSPPGAQLADYTVAVSGFRLLPGLRRPWHWTAVRPSAFDRALGDLCSAFGWVVADVTGEFEGEGQVGSIDVEERNHMSRRVVAVADVVVVVGHAGRVGNRRLRSVVDDLLALGVDPDRVQPVVNRARSDRLPAPVISVPELAVPPGEGGRIPAGPLRAAVLRLVARRPPPDRAVRPARVTPGSLGCSEQGEFADRATA